MDFAYYNEIDPDCVGALHALMEDGLIAPGYIDNRSIKEVTPDDLEGFTQAHFFAGIGVWSYAARLAGWPDRKPLWSMSCPCQPISNAGKRQGANDPRHLWPDGFRLIGAGRPSVVVGEQVAGSLGYNWFDGVRSDLASQNYACRAVDIPACSADAPHIRNRLAWIAERMADSGCPEWRSPRESKPNGQAFGRIESANRLATSDAVGPVADRDEPIIRPIASAGQLADVQHDARDHGECDVVDASRIGRRQGRASPDILRWWSTVAGADARERIRGSGVALGDTESGRSGTGLRKERSVINGREFADATISDGVTQGDAVVSRLEGFDGNGDGSGRPFSPRPIASADGRNGTFWSDAEWLICHDEKARRAKPGIRLLVDGAPARIPRWRAAGNTICAPLFVEVLKAYLETEAY